MAKRSQLFGAPGAVEAHAEGDDRQAELRGEIDGALGELAARAARTVGGDRQVHVLAAAREFEQRFGGAAVGRAADAFEAHVVGEAKEDVGVLVLAQQHRQVAVAAHVEGDEDVLMPEDVDALAADAVDGVDVRVVEEGLVFERAHPGAEAAGGDEAGGAHPERGAVERFVGGGVHPWSRSLFDAGCWLRDARHSERSEESGISSGSLDPSLRSG